MSENKNIKLEIDSKTIEILSNLCSLSGLEVPEVINSEFLEAVQKRVKDILISLKNQTSKATEGTEELSSKINKLNNEISKLKEQLKQAKSNITTTEITTQEAPQAKETAETKREHKRPDKIQNILIISNLGVIMHQLKVLFTNFGCKVTSVKSYSEAIIQLKDQAYECILFDMATTTESDLMLVEALRKATEICETDTLIVSLLLPARDKSMVDKIKKKGADIVIYKYESWHINILKELGLS